MYLGGKQGGLISSNRLKPKPTQPNGAQVRSSAVPVAVDGALEELHGLLGLPQLPVGWFHLSAHAADAGVALERVGPPLGFLIHHPQHVAPALLGCAQLLGHDALRLRLELYGGCGTKPLYPYTLEVSSGQMFHSKTLNNSVKCWRKLRTQNICFTRTCIDVMDLSWRKLKKIGLFSSLKKKKCHKATTKIFFFWLSSEQLLLSQGHILELGVGHRVQHMSLVMSQQQLCTLTVLRLILLHCNKQCVIQYRIVVSTRKAVFLAALWSNWDGWSYNKNITVKSIHSKNSVFVRVEINQLQIHSATFKYLVASIA